MYQCDCESLQTCVTLGKFLDDSRCNKPSLAALEPRKSFQTEAYPETFAIHDSIVPGQCLNWDLWPAMGDAFGCRHGRARYPDGSTYEGDWKQDHRWGWGKHKFAAGGEYEGEWEGDKISGDPHKWVLCAACFMLLVTMHTLSCISSISVGFREDDKSPRFEDKQFSSAA